MAEPACLVGGARTEEEDHRAVQQERESHDKEGSEMQKWLPNSEVELQVLGQPTRSETEVSHSNSSILLLKWDTADCTFSFRFRGDRFRVELQRRFAEWSTRLAELKVVIFPRRSRTVNAPVDASKSVIASVVCEMQRVHVSVGRSP